MVRGVEEKLYISFSQILFDFDSKSFLQPFSEAGCLQILLINLWVTPNRKATVWLLEAFIWWNSHFSTFFFKFLFSKASGIFKLDFAIKNKTAFTGACKRCFTKKLYVFNGDIFMAVFWLSMSTWLWAYFFTCTCSLLEGFFFCIRFALWSNLASKFWVHSSGAQEILLY